MPTQPTVEFWFDPICPFTWITSRWVSEVAEERNFAITWHPFSLKVLNEGLDEGADANAHTQGHRLGRVIESVRAQHGQEPIADLYTAIGTRLHPENRDDFDTIIQEALAEVKLPESHAAAADSTDSDAELSESTKRALAKVGKGVGIPIIAIDGTAFFGPVITPRPEGTQAVELWDALVTFSKTPGFFELKRELRNPIQF